MIDEMYDRAWVEHRQRVSRDMRALLRGIWGALKPMLKRRSPAADGKFDIPVSARKGGECVGSDERSSAADLG